MLETQVLSQEKGCVGRILKHVCLYDTFFEGLKKYPKLVSDKLFTMMESVGSKEGSTADEAIKMLANVTTSLITTHKWKDFVAEAKPEKFDNAVLTQLRRRMHLHEDLRACAQVCSF